MLKQAPGDFDAHDGMGLVRLKPRDFPAALTSIQKAISLSDSDTSVRYSVGLVF